MDEQEQVQRDLQTAVQGRPRDMDAATQLPKCGNDSDTLSNTLACAYFKARTLIFGGSGTNVDKNK